METKEELEQWQADVQEREAAICPEDVPFDEYIRALKAALCPFAAVYKPDADPNEAVFVRNGNMLLNRHLERAARLVGGNDVYDRNPSS